MPTRFTSTQLAQLMALALETATVRDVQFAIRCTRASDQSLRQVLAEALTMARLNRSYLRGALEWGGRYGMADAVEALLDDPRPEVAYGASYAVAEGRSIRQLIEKGAPPQDVASFLELCQTPALTDAEVSMAELILGIREASSAELARLLLLNPARIKTLGPASIEAVETVSLDALLDAARDTAAAPSGEFLRRLASFANDPRAEQYLLAESHKGAPSQSLVNALAALCTDACIDRLIELMSRHSFLVESALRRIPQERLSARLLHAFGHPGAFRRFGAQLVLIHAGAEGISAVVEALTDVLREVRDQALTALIRLGPAATPIFATMAADKASTLRAIAIRSLPKTGGPTVEAVLQGLLQDDDMRVRRAADETLKELEQRAVAERLRQERAQLESQMSGRDEFLSASAKASVIREMVVLGHDDGWDAPAPIAHSPVSEAEKVGRTKATSAAPTLADACYFSVTAPLRTQAASWFIVELWCHEDSPDVFVRQQSRQLGWQPIRSVGPVDVERGTAMEVDLQLPGFDVQEAHGMLRWQGNVGVIGFAARSSAGTMPGTHLGSARVTIGGVSVARVYFQIDLGADERQSADCTASVTMIESAFASYSSEDRDEVLGRIQGMQKILPKLDVFLDVVSLRSGEVWRQRLVEEIACRDAFFLFWSRSARASRWVEFEWRTALKERGPEFIDPVPLESPEIAPPPEELSDRHFGDWSLRMQRSASQGDPSLSFDKPHGSPRS